MSRNPIVYLAGGIAGLAYSDATTWRHRAHMALRERSIETLDPMRAKEALRYKHISQDFRDYADCGALFTAQAILHRDFSDVKRCDAVLVNLLGAKPSMGTVMELGWAFALQKPAVVCIEATGNPHDAHPMVHAAIPFRVDNLDEAIDAVAVVLGR